MIERGKEVKVAGGYFGRVSSASAEGYLVQLYDWERTFEATRIRRSDVVVQRYRMPIFFHRDSVVEVPDTPPARGVTRGNMVGQLVEYFDGRVLDPGEFLAEEQRRIGIVISQTAKYVCVSAADGSPRRMEIGRVMPVGSPVQELDARGTIDTPAAAAG